MVSLKPITSIFRKDVTDIDKQFKDVGLFGIRHNDLAIRMEYMRRVNDFVNDPFIDINDKIQYVHSEIKEIGNPWVAPGGNTWFHIGLGWETDLLDNWQGMRMAWKPVYTYFTAYVEINEERIGVVEQGDRILLGPKTEEKRIRIDGSTYLHFQKIKEINDNMKLIELREHQGRIDRPGKGFRFTRTDVNNLLDWYGTTQILYYQDLLMALVWLPEHVNPRTNIVIHNTAQPQGQGGGQIVPTSTLRRPQGSAAGMTS